MVHEGNHQIPRILMDIEVKDLIRYTGICPSQWEGETTKGAELYIRYRWGFLSVDLNGKEIFGSQVGEEFDGFMSDKNMKEFTKSVINWKTNE